MKDEDLQREEIHKGNRYLLEERDAPRLELSVTICLLEGKRTSSVTQSRSCPPIARGVGGGLQREPEITPTLMPRKENKKGKVSSP